VLLATGVMLAAIVLLFRAVPGSFVPPEDQGYLFGVAFLPDAASLDRTEALTRPAGEMMRAHPAIEHVTEAIGFSTIDGTYKPNAATLFVSLKPAGERHGDENSSFGVIAAVTQGLAQIREGVVLLLNPPSIPGLGGQGGFEFWLQSRGTASPAELGALTRAFIGQAAQRPELRGVSSTFNPASRQLKVLLDREKAETLGVPVQDVYDALQTLFGSLYVSQYDKYSRVWQVILQAEPRYREDPADIAKVFVRTKKGNMVPLSALVTTEWVAGPDAISRFNGFPAAKILGDAADGYSSGDAIRAMEEVAATVLPEGFSYEWSGQALEEKKAGGTSVIVFAFGLVMVFLILAAQYESWSLPTAVIAAVPFGIFGALLAVLLRGLENDVYFQIGLVTLIGLAAKNAILIVEFAVIKLKEGLPAREAAIESAKLRLRPIVMTSAAFILGAVPLAIATGAGANSRHSIGTGIIGGMVAATTLALFFVPLMFALLEGRKSRASGEGAPAAPAQTSGGAPT
jgi:multidrug efflux pump